MLRISSLLVSLLFLRLLSCAAARAAEPVLVVDVASGRQFAGAIDAASSSEELVLRSGGPTLAIRRPIRWERILRATLDGQPIELSELQRRAEAVEEPAIADRGLSSPSDLLPAPEAAELPPALPPENEPPQNQQPQNQQPPFAESIAAAPPARVQSIMFEARIANWDGDVETDGLLLDLLPLDGEGYLTPASGTVEIELFASQRRDFDAAPLAGGDTLERVDRWTRAVEPDDFTSRGGRLKLPFGAVHPEFDQRWLAHYYGLVHARFAAPGHGVFEDSRDGLRIRPYAPLRDRLELYGGRRFLPTERTGRGVSSAANER